MTAEVYTKSEVDALLAQGESLPMMIAGIKPDKLSTSVLRLYEGTVYHYDGSIKVTNGGDYDIDMTVTGAGGLDTGTPTDGVDYFPYVLSKDSDGSFAAVISASQAYGGVTVPTGHTLVRKLRFGFVYNSAWDGIPNFDAMNWPWPFVRLTDSGEGSDWRVLNSGGAASYTNFDLSGVMPDNARVAYILARVEAGATSGTAYLRSPGVANDLPVGACPAPGVNVYTDILIRVNSTRELAYRVTGGVTLSVFVLGYEMTEPS